MINNWNWFISSGEAAKTAKNGFDELQLYLTERISLKVY